MSTPSAAVRWTLILASTLTVLAGAVVAPALPKIGAAFADATPLLTQLVLTLPALAIAITAPFSGVIADRLGRRMLLVASLLLYAVAGLAGAYAPSIWVLLGTRLVLGLAVSGVMTAATTLAGDLLTGEARGRFLSMQGAAMAGGGLVYVMAGGLLADISWQAPFWIYLASLPVAALALGLLHEPDRSGSSSPGVPVQAMPVLAVLPILLMAFVGMCAFYLTPTQVPFLVEDELGLPSSRTGLAIAAVTVTSAVLSALYARVHRRVSFSGIAALSFAGIGVGYGIVAFAPSYLWVVVGLLISGVGTGLVMPNSTTWMLQVAPERARGRLTGLLTASLFLGQFASPFVGNLLRWTPDGLPFGAAAIVLGGLAIVVALAGVVVGRRSAVVSVSPSGP